MTDKEQDNASYDCDRVCDKCDDRVLCDARNSIIREKESEYSTEHKRIISDCAQFTVEALQKFFNEECVSSLEHFAAHHDAIQEDTRIALTTELTRVSRIVNDVALEIVHRVKYAQVQQYTQVLVENESALEAEEQALLDTIVRNAY